MGARDWRAVGREQKEPDITNQTSPGGFCCAAQCHAARGAVQSTRAWWWRLCLGCCSLVRQVNITQREPRCTRESACWAPSKRQVLGKCLYWEGNDRGNRYLLSSGGGGGGLGVVWFLHRVGRVGSKLLVLATAGGPTAAAAASRIEEGGVREK